ncbi:MAG: DNA gyrase subunit A [Acidimicrobiia bacterium]|nr:DNA gyrase subunit A [Acidimicrobiia bacterium]
MPDEATGRIKPIEIEREMEDSFLEYAMSVIVSRALPDVRDGLKPVHRRILYSMFDSGIRPGTPFRKCARVVGDVMGWFHPHSNDAIYDALVRLGQDFSTRYPLVQPQGNFGSVDDGPAAMRYCVTGDTLIRTTSGTRRIADLVEGAEPHSDTPIDTKVLDRRGNPQRATTFFHSGHHLTKRVVTREGYSLVGTGNHPILTLTTLGDMPLLAWKLIDELTEGDVVAIARSETSSEGHALDPAIAGLLGAWIAEGWASEDRAGFNNTDAEFFSAVVDAYDRIVGGQRYIGERRLPSGKTLWELDVHNMDSFVESPLAELAGVRSADKRIPAAVWRSDAVAKRTFLGALFEGDGSSSNLGRNTVQVTYSTRSEQLARDVQLLLLEFGIVGKLARYESGEWKVYLSNRREVRRFLERVGFFGAKQAKARREVAEVPTTSRALSHDHIPFLAPFLRARGKSGSVKWLRKHNVDRVERWERDGEEILARLDADAAAVAGDLVSHGYYYATVDRMEDAGIQPVYSIRVESEDHSFLANGFVNHNTEARMAPLAIHLLDGINESTVDFQDNYSGEREEPTVLPSRFPNLLVNGSTGIAVGMATNIPPHNLNEVVDACLYALDNPDATAADLSDFIQGPDFPTGGYIIGNKGIKDALLTGRGSVKMRAVTDVVEMKKNRFAIIVSEIPYQVSIQRIMEKIADLVNSKTITGISGLRDESNRNGIRIVIELKRDANPQVVLNQLYKGTQLEENFSVNTVALVDGVPKTLNVAEMVHHYLAHQIEVIVRRTQHRLEVAKARAHIVEGLLIALDNIDEVVQIIRGSADVATAQATLMERFELSEEQARHILDMPLRRLTALETEKLREEYAELQETIAGLEAILASEALQREVIAEELEAIRDKFGDDRRSRIIPDEGEMSLEDLIADEELIVTITAAGYVKAVLARTYRTQGRGGRGVRGQQLRADDIISHVLHTTAHAYLLFFSNKGKVYRVRAHELPRKERTAKGVLIQSVLPMDPDERVEAIIDTRDYETHQFLVAFTKLGQVKKTKFTDYDSRNQVLVAIKLQDGDEVVAVRATSGDGELLMFTQNGQGIRFGEDDVRPMGRDTQGVRGIRLREGDEVVAAASGEEGEDVLLLSTGGYGKRTKLSEFPLQKRGGIGVKAMKLTRVRGLIAAARAVTPGDEILITSTDGIVIRTEVATVSRQKRDSTGVRVMNLAADAELSAVALVTNGD